MMDVYSVYCMGGGWVLMETNTESTPVFAGATQDFFKGAPPWGVGGG